MENETIKIFTKVQNTVEALRLAEAGKALFFRRDADGSYFTRHLKSIECNASLPYEIKVDGYFRYCYTLTEIDPCQSPDGCSELEPYMAYVGLGKDLADNGGFYYIINSSGHWVHRFNEATPKGHCAIATQTVWAQKHFPEHCRIRNYQEPDAFEDMWQSMEGTLPTVCDVKYLSRMFFELGQTNSKK
jgi:hypothetical protein